MRGVILEGVTGSGKTRVFGQLQRVLAAHRPSNTKIYLGEHDTDRVLEDAREAGTLTLARVVEHLQQLVAGLELLASATHGSKLRGRGGDATALVVIERFALGHLTSLRMADRASCTLDGPAIDAIAELYRRAGDLGLATVVLRAPSEALAERVLSIRQHRSAPWRDHLASQGDDEAEDEAEDEAIVERHARWQRALLDHAHGLDCVVRPAFVDVGAGWDDDAYAALAGELERRFLAD